MTITREFETTAAPTADQRLTADKRATAFPRSGGFELRTAESSDAWLWTDRPMHTRDYR